MENIRLNLLKDPENVDFFMLEELMKKYPWFSFLRIFWLLKHKKERPDQFDRELKKHIIYIHDRRRLFQILNSDAWSELKKNIQSGYLEEVEKNRPTQITEEEKDLLDFSYNKEESENEENKENEDKEEQNTNESGGEGVNNKEFTNWIDNLNKTDDDREQLIDRFLEIDPGPIPADKKSSLEGDVSKKSIEESESFITDTLAKIYVKQGLYTKAIFAYEKLSLKYPEKSIYFATQIEEIKSLLSNK